MTNVCITAPTVGLGNQRMYKSRLKSANYDDAFLAYFLHLITTDFFIVIHKDGNGAF